ncbi:MAG: hypothetical protein PHU46_17925 [Rhodocyclaceae bacterium]|nr:hypothetical protein [Rhodocyclaceae bacterium]
MDKDQIYFRTRLGEQALAEPMRLLQYNLRRALALVDGRSTASQVVTRFGDAVVGRAALSDLLRSGLIGTDIPDAPSSMAAQARRAADGGKPPAATPVPGSGEIPPWQPGESQARMRSASPIIEEISLSAEEDLEEPVSNLPAVVPRAMPAEQEPARKSLLARMRDRRRNGAPSQHLSVSWPLLALIVSLGVLALVVATLVFFPYASYRPEIEKQLGTFLHRPVKVGKMGVTLTPKPNLTLDQVTVGTQGEVSIGSVKLIPGFNQLLHGNLVFSAYLDGIEMDGRGLAMLSGARGNAFDAGITVIYAQFSNLALSLNDWRLDHLRGNLAVGDQGLDGANVRNDDDSLKLTIQGDGNKLRLSLSALDWKTGGQIVRSLDMDGDMDAAGLRLTRVEGGALNGLVKGSLAVNWSPATQVAGEVSLTRVDVSQLCSVLGVNLPLRGELSGSFRFGGAGEAWMGVANPPQVEGDFRVLRGSLERFDFGMAVRSGGSSWARGGVTGFEELGIGVRRDGQAWQIGSLNLTSGAIHTSGNALIAADGSLSGLLLVSLSDKVKSPVTLAGTLREPLMRAQRAW